MQDQVYPGESSAWNITASEAPLTYRLLLIHDTTLQCTLQYNIPGARQNRSGTIIFLLLLLSVTTPPLAGDAEPKSLHLPPRSPPDVEVQRLSSLQNWEPSADWVYCSVMRIYALIGGGRIRTEMLWWQKGLNIESVPLQRPAVALRVPCCALPTCKLAALVWATGSHLTD